MGSSRCSPHCSGSVKPETPHPAAVQVCFQGLVRVWKDRWGASVHVHQRPSCGPAKGEALPRKKITLIVQSLTELQILICSGTCLQFGRVLTETYRACSVGRASQNSKPMAVINVQLPPSRWARQTFPPISFAASRASCDLRGEARSLEGCWRCSYDINVTPDKRKALIHREQAVLDAFQEVQCSPQL